MNSRMTADGIIIASPNFREEDNRNFLIEERQEGGNHEEEKDRTETIGI